MALASSSAAHLLQNSYPGLALSSWHCSSVLAGTLLLSITLVGSRALCSSFGGKLFSPQRKPLDHAKCILSCCSFHLEFTPLTDLIATNELHTFVLQTAQH